MRARERFWLFIADMLEPFSYRAWLWAICKAARVTDWGNGVVHVEGEPF